MAVLATQEVRPTDPLRDVLAGRRLVVVSDREPFTDGPGGGLGSRYPSGAVAALGAAVADGFGAWVATAGDDRLGGGAGSPDAGRKVRRFRPAGCDGASRFAHSALEPLLHYALDRCRFDERDWRHYERANRRLAEPVAAAAGTRDPIWIDDLHLLRLPAALRDVRPLGGPVVLFLHHPVPAAEVFEVLPWRRETIEGMLGADLVVFETASYGENFLASCRRLLDAQIDPGRGTVRWRGRTVRTAAVPVGVDFDEVEAVATTPAVVRQAAELRRSLAVDKLVLAVDPLEPGKGIAERLDAFEALLRSYPQLHGRVALLQVAAPGRSSGRGDRELKDRIDERVGRINGRFSEAGWVPVRYRAHELDRGELLAHFLAADLLMVTPLRDATNLPAQEYCAARRDEDGVLVVSELIGTAGELLPQALAINPYDVELTAHQLYRGLAMHRAERRRRMALLRRRVREADAHRACARVIEELLGG
jgi:trehalose 6-phosphate synthase